MSNSLRQIILSKMGESYDNLTNQIIHLEEEKMLQEIIKNDCQAEGDLRENQGYHTALEAIQRMEMQLKILNDRKETWNAFKEKWGRADAKAAHIAQVGSLVRLKAITPIQGQNEWEMLIVPQLLGNAELSSLSTSSKVGSAILGKKAGDRLTVRSNRYGTLTYQIISIK